MTDVVVRLHGGLERWTGSAGPLMVELQPGSSLLALQDRLGIPRGEVGLFLVDGEVCHEADVPGAGAQIQLYPLFGGG